MRFHVAVGLVPRDAQLRGWSAAKPSWHMIKGLQNPAVLPASASKTWGQTRVSSCDAKPSLAMSSWLRSVAGAHGRAAGELPRSVGWECSCLKRDTPFIFR